MTEPNDSIYSYSIITQQWRIQDGAFGANAPPSLSGRAIATSFDSNTIHLVIVVRPKSIYI